MNELSTVRLYVLRAMYLFIVIGLGLMIWPLLLNQPENLEHMRGVVWCMLAGVSILALLGIRYPVKMIPVLLFEFVWKLVWLIGIWLPNRGGPGFTAAHQQTWLDCVIGIVLLLIAMPWGYVWRHYVWNRPVTAAASR